MFSSKYFWFFGGIISIITLIAKYLLGFAFNKLESYFIEINVTLKELRDFMLTSKKDKEILEAKINANNELLQSQINEIKLEMKEFKDIFNNQKK